MAGTTTSPSPSASASSSAAAQADYDDLSPTEFVKKIRELGEKKDAEDAERLATLERDILQGRKEREARRAERARSLSPVKSPGIASPRQSLRNSNPSEPPRPSSDATMTTKMADSSASAPPTATQLARSGTLSWQQRPKSRDGGRRPLSWIAQENAARSPRATPEPSRMTSELSRIVSEPTTEPAQEISRSQIAENLGSKDPTWFKQTADRGSRSAALRQNHEDETQSGATVKMRLPGMSREASTETESPTSPLPDSTRSNSPSQASSIRDSTFSNRYSATTAATDPGSARVKSPPTSFLDGPKFDPPPTERASPLATSRPSSPTKGMGGFVESAMLKRADSVNKRWSATPGPGISRNSSTASNRNSYMGGYGGAAPVLDPTPSRDNSLEPASHPTSSHSNLTITRNVDEKPSNKDDEGFVKPSLPAHSHSRSRSIASIRAQNNDTAEPSPPSSPSKRWSPTKSSWLESALTKDDKPKASTQAPPSQPSWMAEINRAKQQRASSPTKEMMESPATTEAKTWRTHPTSSASTSSQDTVRLKSPPPEVAPKPSLVNQDKPNIPTKPASPSPVSKPDILAKPASSSPSPAPKPDALIKPATSSPATKSINIKKPWEAPKPAASAPGKFDFRANLKSRALPSDSGGNAEPEFKNALGNLKRAQTQNYVAPDIFKSNIERGKNALNLTGGPAPRVKKDELKDSLLAKKAEIVQRKESGELPLRPQKPAELPSTPEALARRKTLSKADAPKESTSAMKTSDSAGSEAIAALKSRRENSKPAPPAVTKSSNQPAKDISSTTAVELTQPTEGPSAPQSLTAEKFVPKDGNEKPAQRSLGDAMARTNGTIKATPMAHTTQPALAKSNLVKPGVSGKLAERFNPALANMLARGPPPASASRNVSPGDSPALSRTATVEERSPSSVEPLEHKTKGRARGPKRRAPTKQESPDDQVSSQSTTTSGNESAKDTKPAVASSPQPKTAPILPGKHMRIASAQLVKSKDILPSSPQDPKPVLAAANIQPSLSAQPTCSNSVATSLSNTPSYPAERSQQLQRLSVGIARTPLRENAENNSTPGLVDAGSPSETEPQLGKFVDLRPESPQKETMGAAAIGALFEQRLQSQKTPAHSFEKSSAPESTVESDEQPLAPVSNRGSAALWAKQESSGPFSAGRKLPIKLPTKNDEGREMSSATLRSPAKELLFQHAKSSPVGLGISSSPVSSPRSVDSRPSIKSPMSPPIGPKPTIGNGASAVRASMEKPKLKTPAESPIPQTSEASRLFAEFFDDKPVAIRSEEIDTLAILDSPAAELEKIATTKKQIHEISSDGKLLSVPSHQEHILFDQSMYICTHSFTSPKGSATEVYLWTGSDVSPAAVEDAQLFGRRLARDNNAKLTIIEQGRETSHFLQALGGVVLIFKGAISRNPMGVPPQFLLCGRRHHGHVIFDEVEFSLQSFCSGFPYLISHRNKLYLWKGSGSHQEEISFARLITMDVSPSPDLIEIEEGKEPISFFTMFPMLPKYPKNTIPRSAEHWRLKTRADKYRCRLFRIEQHRSKSMSLQVSTFFSNVIKRRPSWSTFGNASNNTTTTASSVSPPISAERTTSPLSAHSLASVHAVEPSPTSEQPRGSNAGTPVGTPMTTKIVEIEPFSQADLRAESVFVLDAFFEVYVIIGPLARSQAHAFSAALHFAQDYGILAASMQDRPFVPVSTVVVEGAPRDLKFCFRQWDNEKGIGGTEALMAGKPRRAGSLRCVGLSAAIASLRIDS